MTVNPKSPVVSDDDNAIVIGDEHLDEVKKLMKAAIDQNKEEGNGPEVIDIEEYTQAEAKRLANKPVIDQFEDALDNLVPKFKVGDRIIVEMTMKSGRWLETRTGTVKSFDPVTGNIDLHDNDVRQGFYTNFIKGIERGYRYKLVPTGNMKVTLTKKRGRPRKGPEKPVKPVELDANGKPVKRKRGRPKGIKNRPKEEVAAEKAEKNKLRDEKRKAKEARKRGMRIK